MRARRSRRETTGYAARDLPPVPQRCARTRFRPEAAASGRVADAAALPGIASAQRAGLRVVALDDFHESLDGRDGVHARVVEIVQPGHVVHHITALDELRQRGVRAGEHNRSRRRRESSGDRRGASSAWSCMRIVRRRLLDRTRRANSGLLLPQQRGHAAQSAPGLWMTTSGSTDISTQWGGIQMLWIGGDGVSQAATFSHLVLPSSWLSSSVTRMPSLNFAPSSRSATRWWPLNRRPAPGHPCAEPDGLRQRALYQRRGLRSGRWPTSCSRPPRSAWGSWSTDVASARRGSPRKRSAASCRG